MNGALFNYIGGAIRWVDYSKATVGGGLHMDFRCCLMAVLALRLVGARGLLIHPKRVLVQRVLG